MTGLLTAPCRGPQDLDILVTTDLVTLAGPSPFPGVSYRLQKEERCRAQLSHSRGLAREDSSTDPVCVYNSAVSFVRDFFFCINFGSSEYCIKTLFVMMSEVFGTPLSFTPGSCSPWSHSKKPNQIAFDVGAHQGSETSDIVQLRFSNYGPCGFQEEETAFPPRILLTRLSCDVAKPGTNKPF